MTLTKRHRKPKKKPPKVNPATPWAPAGTGYPDPARVPFGGPTGGVPLPMVALYDDDGNTFMALMGEHPPRPAEGYGGYEVIDHPKALGSTDFAGSKPFKLDVPFLLDGFAQGQSVRDQIRALEVMGTADGDKPPPKLTIACAALRTVYRQMAWVVEDIDWGDNVITAAGSMDPLRQDGTVTLRQVSTAKRIKVTAGAGKGKTRPYRVAHGDTLNRIAAKKLGTSTRAPEIKALNPHLKDEHGKSARDVRTKLKAGQTISIPVR